MPHKMKEQRIKQPAPKNSDRLGRRGVIRKVNSIAIPSLILLIVTNSFVLIYQIWTILPDYEHPSAVGNDNNTITMANPNSWGETTNSNLDDQVEIVKRRIRREISSLNSSAIALKRALNDPKNKVVPYDIVPRTLEESGEYYGVVHLLPAIPKHRRMTLDQVHNLTYFLESRERPNLDDHPLYIYNPMLLPLNKEIMDETIIRDLTLGEEDSTVAYVAVFRLSNFANCHGPGRGVPETFRNYLGIALLDKDLNIVKDRAHGNYLNVIIDVNQDLFDANWNYCKIPKHPEFSLLKQWMQDCQLIAAHPKLSKTRNQLILLCNEYAWPVLLQRERAPTRVAPMDDGKHDKSKIYFKNKYGRGLHLTAIRHPNELLEYGKNLHFFTAGADANGPGFLEIWAAGPHTVLPVTFEGYPFVRPGVPPRPMESKAPEPNASYVTLDARRPEDTGDVLRDRDNGSACCVPIIWRDGSGHKRKLLMGVSHTKTRRGKAIKKSKMYNYVSRLYAFDPIPPFDIIARSGYFCLGFGLNKFLDNPQHDEAEQSDNDQVWGATNEYKLNVRDDFFECPRIHFVSGITEKIDDPDTVVISYGINDCYPRVLEVSKNFLVQLLLPRN
mmetsp:Transcript_12671/g.25315  ORF Transcript_12671/g.25315 Transcript_12671/m.25315 type:complete len:613 (-) Transcript_12671:314-2152(-)